MAWLKLDFSKNTTGHFDPPHDAPLAGNTHKLLKGSRRAQRNTWLSEKKASGLHICFHDILYFSNTCNNRICLHKSAYKWAELKHESHLPHFHHKRGSWFPHEIKASVPVKYKSYDTIRQNSSCSTKNHQSKGQSLYYSGNLVSSVCQPVHQENLLSVTLPCYGGFYMPGATLEPTQCSTQLLPSPGCTAGVCSVA